MVAAGSFISAGCFAGGGIGQRAQGGCSPRATLLRCKTADIKRGEKLQILGKKGAWLNVKTTKAGGWVRLLSVKRGAASSGGQIKGVLDVASGRAGTGKVVATTGVRGLNEEELKNAKYSEAEVKKLESFTITSGQAQQFAKSGGLKAVKINYLPASK
jgi:hypothetical protein